MARKPRVSLPGITQHIVLRGNNREPCFFNERDYSYYLECLLQAVERYDCSLHAYVLMTNHVHLLVTPQVDWAVAQVMQSLGGKYMKYINRVYRRTGTLWQGRYKVSLVDSSRYLLACMRYIELNPVRAGMTELPSDYPWSSYRTNASDDKWPRLTQHPVYRALGASDQERQGAYRTLFSDVIDEAPIHEIRNALNSEQVLGCVDFREKIERVLHRKLAPGKPGRPGKIEESPGVYYVY